VNTEANNVELCLVVTGSFWYTLLERIYSRRRPRSVSTCRSRYFIRLAYMNEKSVSTVVSMYFVRWGTPCIYGRILNGRAVVVLHALPTPRCRRTLSIGLGVV